MGPGARLSPSERRRSARILIRVPVRVSGITQHGTRVSQSGEAVVISRHGALLKVGSPLKPGSEVDVENPSSHEMATFRVVWTSDQPSAGRWDVGVEWSSGAANIWGIDFPAAVRETG
ncbi:MAG: PilZ domain-containing protein [Acidobacteria bacterium]|nr:PilZ domain-containing protein [Acidobacteriota bacterium]